VLKTKQRKGNGDEFLLGAFPKPLGALTRCSVLLPLCAERYALNLCDRRLLIKHDTSRLPTRFPERIDEDATSSGQRCDPLGKLVTVANHCRKKKKVGIRDDAIERQHAEHAIESAPQTG
jgi:hypothetical protein